MTCLYPIFINQQLSSTGRGSGNYTGSGLEIRPH